LEADQFGAGTRQSRHWGTSQPVLEQSVVLAHLAQTSCCCTFKAHGEFIMTAVEVMPDRYHPFGCIRRSGCADVRHKVTDQNV
jgi:hypothetical protein